VFGRILEADDHFEWFSDLDRLQIVGAISVIALIMVQLGVMAVLSGVED
jgi:hypothetical protein